MSSSTVFRNLVFIVFISIADVKETLAQSNEPPIFVTPTSYGFLWDNPGVEVPCFSCYTFVSASCQSVYGDQPETIDTVGPCPATECEDWGGCPHIFYNFMFTYESLWGLDRDMMVPVPRGGSGYHVHASGSFACKTVFGCSNCKLNPNTMIKRCSIEAFDEMEMPQGAICYRNVQGVSQPQPITCDRPLVDPWIPNIP